MVDNEEHRAPPPDSAAMGCGSRWPSRCHRRHRGRDMYGIGRRVWLRDEYTHGGRELPHWFLPLARTRPFASPLDKPPDTQPQEDDAATNAS